jgi:hypothetical protein
MRRCLPFCVDPAQTIVVKQVPQHGFHRPLAQAAPALPRPTLLALPGAQVSRIVGRAHELFLGSRGHASGFEGAGLAVAVLGPVILEPVAILTRAVVTKR